MRTKVISWFITPHGFGHAARSIAIMEALNFLDERVKFEIFTCVPDSFFKQAKINYNYNYFKCDIGLIQKDAFTEDLDSTLNELNSFLPFSREAIKNLSDIVRNKNTVLIVCDIAPIGIIVALTAGLPSVLVENFTWDWIYENYLSINIGFRRHVDYLRYVFNQASFIIQTEPVCLYRDNASLIVNPVARKIRVSRDEMRRQILGDNYLSKKIVLISIGGIKQNFNFLELLSKYQNFFFIITGSDYKIDKVKNTLFLKFDSTFFHPDIVNASDAVIAKLGYSTVAEVFLAGVPFGYIPRLLFRESECLINFVNKKMFSCCIDYNDFQQGTWLELLDKLCSFNIISRNDDLKDGALKVAEFLMSKIY